MWQSMNWDSLPSKLLMNTISDAYHWRLVKESQNFLENEGGVKLMKSLKSSCYSVPELYRNHIKCPSQEKKGNSHPQFRNITNCLNWVPILFFSFLFIIIVIIFLFYIKTCNVNRNHSTFHQIVTWKARESFLSSRVPFFQVIISWKEE